jgi:hypothetical protein
MPAGDAVRDADLLRVLAHLIELETALSKRNVRVGREHFFGAVSIIGKAIESARRGRK